MAAVDEVARRRRAERFAERLGLPGMALTLGAAVAGCEACGKAC